MKILQSFFGVRATFLTHNVDTSLFEFSVTSMVHIFFLLITAALKLFTLLNC